MKNMQPLVEAFHRDEGAAALVEYALLLGSLGICVIFALAFVGEQVQDIFELTSDHIQAAITGQDPVEVASNNGKRRWHNKNFLP